ncbi:MAG: SO2930 family diheme c-type cytochrome [Pseudomonadota bacterium]
MTPRYNDEGHRSERRGFRFVAGVLGLALMSAAPSSVVDDAVLTAERPPMHFADFGFFLDTGATRPAPRVTGYGLNSALFSDHADKARYIYVPPGDTLRYDGEGLLQFPVGSAMVKHFGFTRTDGSLDLIESRVLVKTAAGWAAYPYVWNADDSDAVLKRAGARLKVAGHDADGAPLALDWRVPNVNQCKGCHAVAGELMPIGPKARNLNGSFAGENNLARLTRLGLLTGVPQNVPAMPDWHDEAASIDARARAYLDVNCGHCHNPAGPASNSGLNLTWETVSGPELGINKAPVAAGRGSGGRHVAIAPGDPDGSILLYRMDSTEAGVMMPELARTQRDGAAVDLIREWIGSLE